MQHRPLYQLLATYLNGHGGKKVDPEAKKIPPHQLYSPEDLMPPNLVPPELRPFRFTPGEAQAILDAIPHLHSGGNWAWMAIVNRLMPHEELKRQAKP